LVRFAVLFTTKFANIRQLDYYRSLLTPIVISRKLLLHQPLVNPGLSRRSVRGNQTVTKPKVTEDIVSSIEDALEERKTPKDRRQVKDPNHPHATPDADRRSGQDRRSETA
jgi:hypothetical protein